MNMTHRIIRLAVVILLGCSTSRLIIPKYEIDPSSPNRHPLLLTPGELTCPDIARELEIEDSISYEKTIK
jgi:hypothetical protein